MSELLQGFRGRLFHSAMLRRFGHGLALVDVTLPGEVAARVVDLDDPAELVRIGVAPGTLASDDRRRTQVVARALFDRGAAGLRWWSRLSGDWHTTVLFLARAPIASLTLGTPARLSRGHPAVIAACTHLGIVMR